MRTGLRAIAVLGALLFMSDGVLADDGSFGSAPSETVIAHEGTVGSLIVGAGGQVGGAGSGGGDGCSWEIADFSGTPTGNDEADASGALYRNHPTDGRRQVAIQKVCDGEITAYGWAYTTPTPAQLIDGVRSEVVRQLPDPAPAISPPGPGWVNLGLWLAVEPVEPVTVENSVVGYQVRVTATPVRTSFRIDDQEPIVCDGFGTPIVDLDTVEQGPCGYTFRQVTSPGRPATITVTTTWSIDYLTSVHGAGHHGELDLSTAVAYEVGEIQTVGTRG